MATNSRSGRSLQDILDTQRSIETKYTKHNKRDTFTKKQIKSNKVEIKNNVSKDKSYTCNDNDFPELIIVKNDTKHNELDFKNVVNKTRQNIENTEKVYPGWTTINRKTKKITTYDTCGNIIDKNTNVVVNDNNIDSDQIYSLYNKLSRRWCNYYDSINYLLGDRSPYINYDYEINKIVQEDNEMFKNMYDNIDDSFTSDDEYLNIDDL